MKVEKVGQKNLRVYAPRVSQKVKAVLSRMHGPSSWSDSGKTSEPMLTQLPMVSLKYLLWPRGCKTTH
jgi:hypothetical protein